MPLTSLVHSESYFQVLVRLFHSTLREGKPTMRSGNSLQTCHENHEINNCTGPPKNKIIKEYNLICNKIDAFNLR